MEAAAEVELVIKQPQRVVPLGMMQAGMEPVVVLEAVLMPQITSTTGVMVDGPSDVLQEVLGVLLPMAATVLLLILTIIQVVAVVALLAQVHLQAEMVQLHLAVVAVMPCKLPTQETVAPAGTALPLCFRGDAQKASSVSCRCRRRAARSAATQAKTPDKVNALNTTTVPVDGDDSNANSRAIHAAKLVTLSQRAKVISRVKVRFRMSSLGAL